MSDKIPDPNHDAVKRQILRRSINYFRSKEGEPRLFTKRKIFLFLLTALYAAFPLDIIPDFIPIFGQADDLSLIAFTFLALFLPPIKSDNSNIDPKD